MKIYKLLVLFVLISFKVINMVYCQIPKYGSFSYTNSLENPNEPPNPVLAAFNESQQVIFYNDTLIVMLQNSAFTDQSYQYINKKNGNCTIVERENGIYVQTNTKDLNKAFDILGINQSMDTISFDTVNFEYLRSSCKKVFKKYDTSKATYFVINTNLSYYSNSDNKQIYIPLEENVSLGGYSYFKSIHQRDTTFDLTIFSLDTIGLKKISLQSFVNQKLGFQVIPDSSYNSEYDANNMFSWFGNNKTDDITKDTFYSLLEITLQSFNNEKVKLDSIRSSKLIEPALLNFIDSNINTHRINDIIRHYFYNKILKTEKDRKTLLENLEYAGIQLKNGKSPTTLEKYIKEGYALDQLISDLKGYERMVINLENLNYVEVIKDIFKIVLPEYAHQSLRVKIKNENIDFIFNDINYKLDLRIIYDNPESSLYYKNVFITQNIRELFTKIFVDLDLKKKIGIIPISQFSNLYRGNQKVDTFLICTYDKNTGIKRENLQIGLSFHDSLKISKQLQLQNLYSEEGFGNYSSPLDFEKNKYLKTNQLKEFQRFYRKVGSNNKYIRKMMLETAENIPYELTDMGRIFVFFFEFYLDEGNFIPLFFMGTAYDKKTIDTLSDFNIAFPKIYNLLNQKLNFKNISMKKINDWQYEVNFEYQSKRYKISGTLEDVGFGCAKAIDQILALNKELNYRIFTSLENNEFYKKLVILRNDELPFFKQATGISLSTLSP